MLNKNEVKTLVKLLQKAGKDVSVDMGYISVTDDCMEDFLLFDIQSMDILTIEELEQENNIIEEFLERIFQIDMSPEQKKATLIYGRKAEIK